MNYNIALIKGDGIGPEIVSAEVQAVQKVGKINGHSVKLTEYLAGSVAIDETEFPLPDETVGTT